MNSVHIVMRMGELVSCSMNSWASRGINFICLCTSESISLGSFDIAFKMCLLSSWVAWDSIFQHPGLQKKDSWSACCKNLEICVLHVALSLNLFSCSTSFLFLFFWFLYPKKMSSGINALCSMLLSRDHLCTLPWMLEFEVILDGSSRKLKPMKSILPRNVLGIYHWKTPQIL